jgi:hypothetical protein
MKRRKKIEEPERPDGWYWCRLWVNLRHGAYNHSWLPARILNGRVQLFGSSTLKPADAPVLENALWSGPIQPPPLEEPPRIALARAGNRPKRNTRQDDAASDPRVAAKAKAVAEGIVDAFVSTVDSLEAYYGRQEDHRAELVQKIANLLEQAFGGRSTSEEA